MWTAVDEEASSGDIIRYDFDSSIAFTARPDGYIWTHLRIAYETPSGIVIEQCPFHTQPGIERRIRARANTSCKVWLQFGAEEALILVVTNGANFSVSDVITGVTSGTTATVVSKSGNNLTVTRPSGGTGLFIPEEDLEVSSVVVGAAQNKIASHGTLDADVIYSEWSEAKTVTTTTGTPYVLALINGQNSTSHTVTPLPYEGFRIQLFPRGFDTIDPRNDLDFQSEITTVSEQGNLTYVPATLNHPTNRHIGYSDVHTMTFLTSGSKTIRHTIRNFDASESATLDTSFTVGDTVADGGWTEIWDVDESGLFTAGTATGSNTTTSWATAFNSARTKASALIRVHGTVNVPDWGFGGNTIQNVRVEGVGSSPKIDTGDNLNAFSMQKVVVCNLEVEGNNITTDPMSPNTAAWPNSGMSPNSCDEFSVTLVKFSRCRIPIFSSGGNPDDYIYINDCYAQGNGDYGFLLNGQPLLIHGWRCEADIDQPRGAETKADFNAPAFPHHGGTSRSSVPTTLTSLQKMLMFTNMSWGGNAAAPGINSQPCIRVFGDASTATGTYRICYSTIQSGGLAVFSTAALNNVKSQDLIMDGLHVVMSEDPALMFECAVGGTILRNTVFTRPNTPRNTEANTPGSILTFNNKTAMDGLLGMLDNRFDEIAVYNNTFVTLMDDTNATVTIGNLSYIDGDSLTQGATYTEVNNIDHRPNSSVTVIADAPLDSTTTFTSIYTGYLTWDHDLNVLGPRRTDLAHSAIDTAIWTPTTGSAAVEDATTGRIAIRDITGAFRQDKITARGGTNAYRGAVEGTVTS